MLQSNSSICLSGQTVIYNIIRVHYSLSCLRSALIACFGSSLAVCEWSICSERLFQSLKGKLCVQQEMWYSQWVFLLSSSLNFGRLFLVMLFSNTLTEDLSWFTFSSDKQAVISSRDVKLSESKNAVQPVCGEMLCFDWHVRNTWEELASFYRSSYCLG